MSTLKIRISSKGLSCLSVLTFSINVQTSIPFVTRPKTVCLLSNHGVATVVMKTGGIFDMTGRGEGNGREADEI
jgi:hypothetical protein